MVPDSVLEKFIERCPAAVMVRATLERLLGSERIDEIFHRHRRRQYDRQMLCSQLVALMTGVAARTHQSVYAAYLAAQKTLGVSSAALDQKLAAFDPQVTAALVRETAADMSGVVQALPKAVRTVLPGYSVQYLDGNHLAATEHRLAPLRTTREGPLPGQTLAVLDAQTDLITELVPCECGHAQERSLLAPLLERTTPGTVTIADRNFCTTLFLDGLAEREAHFVIRQHASTLTILQASPSRQIGRCETGTLSEQSLTLAIHQPGEELVVRRITLLLDAPTEAGDRELRLLTNLPLSVSAKRIAAAYRRRWTIEGAFQTLTDVLRCEVETLGYPRAALFSFATAVLAWNAYAVVQAALRSAHGSRKIDETLSDAHLVRDVALTQTGMDIAVDPAVWTGYGLLSAAQFARTLERLARQVDLSRYPKSKRGPKKPRPKRRSGRTNHHLSTAKLLAKAKRKRKPRP